MFDKLMNLKLDKGTINIVLYHQGLIQYGGTLTNSDLNRLKDMGVSLLALGHIHIPFEHEGWVFNPGSIEYTSSNDWGNSGGVYIIELKDGLVTESHHITTVHRPVHKYVINIDDTPLADVKNLYIENGSLVDITLIGKNRVGARDVKRLEKDLIDIFSPLRLGPITNKTGQKLSETSKPTLKSESDYYSAVFNEHGEKARIVVETSLIDSKGVLDLDLLS